MATDLVRISAVSDEIVFSGNMYKAPPLDRKKRKKWHQRHFVLRANRTLECYKSLKAAESNKSPRKIIDLRECISLEIGLEYKSYGHILSLGTFKRTFFFAAPSDPLMLQWANVLEKTKNAKDGECIEVLDIGLRKVGGLKIVQRVRPPSPTQRFSIGTRRHFATAKKEKSLTHNPRNLTQTVSSRGSDQPLRKANWAELQSDDLTSPQRPSSFNVSSEFPGHAAAAQTTSSFSKRAHQPRSRSKSPHRVPLKLRAQLSTSSRSSQSSQTTSTTTESSQFDRPSSLSSQQSSTVSPSHVTATQSHMISPAVPSSHVPPPTSIVTAAKRNEDGFFVDQKKLSRGSGSELTDHASKEETDSGNVSFRSKSKGTKRREFVIKDGTLQRSRPGRNLVRRKFPNSPSPKHEATVQGRVIAGNDIMASMRQSFRYKMITLRAEKPIFTDKIRETSDSEDEDDEDQVARVSGTDHGLPAGIVPPPTGARNQSQLQVKQVNQVEDTQWSSQPNLQQRPELEPRDKKLIGQRRANSYSKLTVTGVKSLQPPTTKVMLPEHLSARLNAKNRQRSSSQSDLLESNNKSQLTSNMTSLSQDDILMESTIHDNAAAAQMLGTGLSIDEADVFDILPARPPSDGFRCPSRISVNSLDNILEPPDMFSEGSTAQSDHYTELKASEVEPQSRPDLSRGTDLSQQTLAAELKKPVPRARSKLPSQPAAVRQFHVGHMTIEPSHVTSTTVIHTSSKPLQRHQIEDTLNPNLVDRNSTESNDTGYTSPGASPNYSSEEKHSTQACMQEFKLKFKESDENEITPDINPPAGTPSGLPTRDKGKPNSFDKQSSIQLSQSSITSASSDIVRFYVPLIFYKPESKVERYKIVKSLSPTGVGSNMFTLQVCLVEDSEDLIKDLVSLKSLEGYSIVECDEIEGSSNVSSAGDDFTVETALEDLEFGFTVIKSTQKDLFMRKVRQFHFEIQKLFGSSKPFTCDVVVRHADQITVLSIEVNMKS